MCAAAMMMMMMMHTRSTLLLLLLLTSGSESFTAQSPYGSHLSRSCSLFSASTNPATPLRKTDDPELPPGRPTIRFLRFLFDDSLKLLNPKTMGSYQVAGKKRFGGVFKTNIFFQPAAIVVSESTMKDLANEEARTQQQQQQHAMEASFPPHHKSLFGPQSLLVQSGATHARLRRLIQPSLSPLTMTTYYRPTIDAALDAFLDKLVVDKYEEPFPVVPELRQFFIDIALEVLIGGGTVGGTNDGSSSSSFQNLSADISTWSRGLLAPPLAFLPWSTAGKAMKARKRIANQLAPLIEAERKNLSSGGDGDGPSLLGKLCSATDEEGATLSTDDIIDNVLTLIFAGSDTTASAATSLWMALSQHPDLKNAIRSDPTLADGLVKKVLEAYPPAPFSMRLARESIRIGDYTIPAGWLVVYGFAGALHRDDPTDWSPPPSLGDGSGGSSSSPSSAAFGAGPRMCPGRYLASLELALLCRKLAKLDWTLVSDQKLEQRYTPGYFPMDGLKIEFTPSSMFMI